MGIISQELPIAAILLRMLGVVALFVVGRWFAKNSRSWLKKILFKQGLPKSIITVLANLTYSGIWLVTLITILALIGIPVEALIAGVVLVVVILGIALRESLSNFAATIIFALFKPFEVGDLIKSGDTMGVVQEIELFNTVLLSYDNKVHILPNGLIQTNGITNLSKMGQIRLDLRFSIGYQDDIALAKQTLFDMLARDGRVLPDPPPNIFVKNLGDSGVEIAVWPYVRLENYYAFLFDVLEQGKLRLEDAGLTIPFPQRDIHLSQIETQVNEQ